MLTLICQYYVPKEKFRRDEIDTCFRKNIENPLITKMLIFFERKEDMALLPDLPKIEKRFYAERLTYGFWLKETNKMPTGTLSLIINSDIYLTESIAHLISNKEYLLKEKKFVALTRYNPNTEGEGFVLNSNPHWTQDTWAIVKPEQGFSSALIQETSFELGQPGCDNKIVAVMHSYGFNVTNPCGTVHTIHLQADEKRSYDGRINKLIGLHAFSYANNTVFENARLEFDLLSRNLDPYEEIRVNNWINDSKSYTLKPDLNEISEIIEKYKIYPDVYEPSFSPILIESYDDFVGFAGVSYVKQQSFDLNKYKLKYAYDTQYSIFEDQSYFYFKDQYWPNVRRISKDSLPFDISSDNWEVQLFVFGFMPITLELEGFQIGTKKKHDDDFMFWQMPAKTEAEAFDRHKKITNRDLSSSTIETYIGMPWASIIDFQEHYSKNKEISIAIVGLLSIRIKSAAKILKKHGLTLKVHTVCQHVYWQNALSLFKKIGITDLWLSHCKDKHFEIDGIKLHSWSLYPLNALTPSHRLGFDEVNEKPSKLYLASFVGGHMPHYISDTRKKIFSIYKDDSDIRVELTNEWFLQSAVSSQLTGAAQEINYDQVYRYNSILGASKFSLCPDGSGPNTIRLWESIFLGVVPVLFDREYKFPTLILDNNKVFDWSSAVVYYDSKNLEDLKSFLLSIDDETIQSMSTNCKIAASLLIKSVCLDSAIKSNEKLFQQKKPVIYVPLYGEEDKYFWRTVHHGFYDLVMDWKAKGYCEVVHHNGPYFWLNKIGDILLFDRDQVADLYDKKLVDSRWSGEVPYKLGFFSNEYNLENDRNMKMNYWSYKPIVLEKYSQNHKPLSFEERTINSVFLGSMENESQEFFRNKFKHWGDHIDEFFVADKLNLKEKSKYDFDGYLNVISKAKFGISFRGNGPKCYREIEYAAMGIPMILTDGVDTTYPDPLIEGVHYFIASSPIEMKAIIDRTSKDVWGRMSKNCRAWYLKNFTSDSHFDFLMKSIEGVNLNKVKPTNIYITESAFSSGYDKELTKNTALIFNPNLVFVDDPDLAETVIDAGDIVINEIPYDGIGDYVWKCRREELTYFKIKIATSNLLKYKRLAALLKWRLAMFRVCLTKGGYDLPVENYISSDGILRIEDPQVNYHISIDYDYCRRLYGKYEEKTISGLGAIVFPAIVITEAILYYQIGNIEFAADITDKYSEYVSINSDFIPENIIWRKFKLWEFEGADFNRIIVRFNTPDLSNQIFMHNVVKYYP